MEGKWKWVAAAGVGVGAYLLYRAYYHTDVQTKGKSEEEGMYISSIFIYPVKSCGPIAVHEARIEAQGLLYDRRWMVCRALCGENGVHAKVSQRECPIMCRIKPEIADNGLLTLHFGDLSFAVPAPEDKSIRVEVWDAQMDALDCGDEVAEWLSAIVKIPVRLVFAPESMRRPIGDQDFVKHLEGQIPNSVWFSDAFPFMFVTQEVVDFCNQKVKETDPNTEISADRFRPNFVIRGSSGPTDADSWRRVRVDNTNEGSSVSFEFVKPCTRCTMPNINQQTAERTKQPALVLKVHRNAIVAGKESTCMGVNAVQIGGPGGIIRVGDAVVVESRGPGLDFV